MNQVKNVFLTLLIGVIALAALDIMFNQGQTIAALVPDRTAVSVPLDGQNLVNQVTDPRIVIDTSAPATVVFSQPPQPQIVTATPGAPSAPVVVLESPAATSTQQPESVIDYADDILAQPTRDYQLTDDQLASCIAAQVEQRRLAPYCPPNPAEYAGPGR
jgi:hypothetical protein